MRGYFEDASSIDYSLTQKYPFYCFTNSSWQNDFPMAAHWHYYVEILYCTTGHGKVIVNGHTHDLLKGEVIFTFPKDVHTINTVNSEPLEYTVIKLNPDILFDLPKDAFFFKHLRQLIAPIPHQLQHIRHLNGFNTSNFKEVHDLFINRPVKFEWMLKSYLFDFFYAYSNHLKAHGFSINGDASKSDDISSLSPAFEFIHAHYMEPISASDTALHCHLSYTYFSRQFKKITGISFTQYLNFIRINEAEKLLLSGSISVTDIGFMVGFADTSYFIRQFKSCKKITPKKFLQLIKDDF